MKFISILRSSPKRLFSMCVLAGIFCCCFPPTGANAMQLYQGSDFSASLDTTFSYSIQYRVEKADKGLIGNTAGGNNPNVFWDDGDLNYNRSVVSNMFKVISELELKSKYVGAFARGTAFYDIENEDGSRERYELSDDAKELVGSDVKYLDAYVWAGVDSGDLPFQIRVGEQVLNWGESTFILGGIGLNTFNPIDVSKLRVPGAELRDALLPEGMIYASVGFLQDFTLEGTYLYSWTETELDPVGSYWGVTDFAGKGNKKLVAPNYYLAAMKAQLDLFSPALFPAFFGQTELGDRGDASANDTIFGIPMGEAVYPDHQGQWGVALRYYAEWLNNTELSVYFMNYHSKMPTLNARGGGMAGIGAMLASAMNVYNTLGAAPTLDPNTPPGDADYAALFAGLNSYLKSCQYRVQYQEDIPTIAFGWNTELLGWGFQGEVSHRKDVRLQVDDTELLAAMIGVIPSVSGIPLFDQSLDAIRNASQLGSFEGQLDTWLTDAIERDQTQIQITLSKLFGPLLGSSGSTFLAEVGYQHTHNMPDKHDLRLMTFNAHGTGNPVLKDIFTPNYPTEDYGLYPDADACGYVLLGFLDYDNVIGPLGVSPRLAWSHDFYGTSPNGGPFIEDRRAITYGLGFRYLNWFTADLSYTCYFGAGNANNINDRDFVGFSIKTRF